MEVITLGFSPCPNDTFIFGALVNDQLMHKDLSFQYMMEDVEYLNKAAMAGDLDVVKVSYFAFTKLADKYQLLTSGGALGTNCGPLVISKTPGKIPSEKDVIAIPGENTTANLLLTLAYPECTNKEVVLFSEIEKGVQDGKYDFGLIIHESRFTYEQNGLFKVRDLGEFWEEYTGTPIPLGAIAIKKTLPENTKKRINELISESLQYAYDHRDSAMDFVKQHAQEMDPFVMQAHIDLYVTPYSMDLGDHGKMAASRLFHEIELKLGIKEPEWPIFV
ncbi:MAG: 1,4-dihydroxy-6-naphthoate synthase [Saprospiraceae bacterium]|nr:1,4-dihydroxy-6-naphthoate synthase [Saprospiraceae bacterium]